MQKIYLIILAALMSGFLFSCHSNTISLEKYALQVKDSTHFGEGAERYLSQDTSTTPPDERLSLIYKDIYGQWKYNRDSDRIDHFTNADNIIKSKNYIGDCEDIASVMFCICRGLKLAPNLCLGEITKEKKGHVWVEVQVCKVQEFDPALHNRLKRVFGGDVSFVLKDSAVFLEFIDTTNVKKYHISHTIDTNGILTPVKEYKLL
jgi:hypothetical protein